MPLSSILDNLTLHHRPHWISRFEGFYSKFQLPSGAYLIIIVCTIHSAPDPANRNNVNVTFYPAPDAPDQSVWQADLFPRTMTINSSLFQKPWSMEASEGDTSVQFRYAHDDTLSLHVADTARGLDFSAHSAQRVPWDAQRPGGGGPEAWLVYLPLPLHWHVHSLASTATYTLALPAAAKLDPRDAAGAAVVHEEKNWAVSFPVAHNWIQGADGQGRFISVAGGQTLGMQAFLAGYRNASKGVSVDVRPPWALRVLGLAPCMAVQRDWAGRRVELDVAGLTQRLRVRACAPQGSFFSLGAPYPEGFRGNWLAQSMRAEIEVQVLERRWPWEAWRLVDTALFENGGLEFGGEYYPPRGTRQTVH